MHQFENVDQDIKAYIDAGGDDRLELCKKAVTALKDQIALIDLEIEALLKVIREVEESVTNMRQMERSVADNLKYRELQAEITRMRTKIFEMEKENAQTELNKYQEQAEKLRKALNKWTAEVKPPIMKLITASHYGG
jgi:trans-2-enoyl-CoA reductase